MRKLATADRGPRDLVSALEGVQQVPTRDEVTDSGPPPPASTPRSRSSCPTASRCCAARMTGGVVAAASRTASMAAFRSVS